MAGEWSRVGSLAGTVVEPSIGDVWVDKLYAEAAFPTGRVFIADVLPFPVKDAPPPPVEKVCIEHHGGSREWLTIKELRERFAFRRKA